MFKIILLIFFSSIVISFSWLYGQIYWVETQRADSATFNVLPGETVPQLGRRLESENIIGNAWLFNKYLVYKGIDRQIEQGKYNVEAPITMARVADALRDPRQAIEKTLTIIPGWTLREIATYLDEQGVAAEEEVFALLGKPAVDYRIGEHENLPTDRFNKLDLLILRDKPRYLSYDGYLAPDTYRVYRDAALSEVVEKLLVHRNGQITDKMYQDLRARGRTFFQALTMASVLEREARGAEDKALIADIFWRRLDMNWALQADSTIHYILGGNGTVFTSQNERAIDSYWNTYKYPGLPLGPIGTPGLESIEAAIYPRENDYWYFLTTLDSGEVIYAKTLEEHNYNVARYLR